MFCILRSFIRCVFVKLCSWCGFSGSTVTAEVKVLTTCQFHPPRRHKLPFFLFFVESAQSWTDLCTRVGTSVLFRTLIDKSNTNFNHHDSKYVQPHVTNLECSLWLNVIQSWNNARIRPPLSFNASQTIVRAFISSQLDDCVGLLTVIKQKLITTLLIARTPDKNHLTF